eukprot:scaffold277_cov261-Pinguiococcus_pyrenoidosus.AAC.15
MHDGHKIWPTLNRSMLRSFEQAGQRPCATGPCSGRAVARPAGVKFCMRLDRRCWGGTGSGRLSTSTECTLLE